MPHIKIASSIFFLLFLQQSSIHIDFGHNGFQTQKIFPTQTQIITATFPRDSSKGNLRLISTLHPLGRRQRRHTDWAIDYLAPPPVACLSSSSCAYSIFFAFNVADHFPRRIWWRRFNGNEAPFPNHQSFFCHFLLIGVPICFFFSSSLKQQAIISGEIGRLLYGPQIHTQNRFSQHESKARKRKSHDSGSDGPQSI